MIREKLHHWKTPLHASLALAFASLGDAFLYAFLPLQGADLHVSALWIGVLLSVNRFIRIVGNSLIVYLCRYVGVKEMVLGATLLAVCTTAGYGLSLGVTGWLLLRILWGLSFATLRIVSLGYSLLHPNVGLSAGVSRGVPELGPMTALLIGPLLLEWLKSQFTFFALAMLSLPAVYFAFCLPALPYSSIALTFRKGVSVSSFNGLTFLIACLAEGMLVVLLAGLLLQAIPGLTVSLATTLAAGYLLFRRICLVLLAPVGGWLSGRIGREKVFSGSTLLIGLALGLLAWGWVAGGLILLFASNGLNAAIIPVKAAGRTVNLGVIAENATFRDAGTALGGFIGGMLLAFPNLDIVLLLSSFLMLLVLLWHVFSTQLALKFFLLWK